MLVLRLVVDYNIPSNNRELQHTLSDAINLFIITYQVITGNYSGHVSDLRKGVIITYQVITGNYSNNETPFGELAIITYQVITGNYSV